MKLKMHLTEFWDEYCYCTTSQCLEWNDGINQGEFSVNNLNECPEDAIIGRDLFTAYDFVEAIKFGMSLAKQGYDDIELIEHRVNKGEE